jgi:twitching motility two-component system response regulator PilH
MGMFDALKRWLEGEQKPASSRPSVVPRPPLVPRPPVRPAAPSPAAPTPAPAATPAAPASAAPVARTDAPVTPIAPVAPASTDSAAVPAAAAGAPSRFEPERREKPRVNARSGTKVLIIDDSPTIVALLKRMLEQSGYEPIDAVDAETGLALALSKKPDLIFLDIVLPGMNGFEALRRLRRDPVTKVTPIIMISGNELATEQFYAQRIGADDFMKKPFSRSEVFARIEKLLDADMVPRRQTPAVAAASAAATPTLQSVAK